MDPFVTIIMPIRNEEEYIARSLDSIRQQDYPAARIEILVVDGMSTDATRAIVSEMSRELPHLQLLDNPQQIVPTALNIGLAHSRGEIIVRVDGHVVLEPGYISGCIATLQERPEADCAGGIITSMNHTFLGEAIALAMSSSFGVGNSYFRTRKQGDEEGYVDSLAFGAYRREVFDRIGLFDEELVRNQDDEFNYRLRKSGGKIFLTPRIHSWYFSRLKIRPLWRQFYQYGLWKIRVLQKHFAQMRLRQFVPPAFVLSLLLSGLVAMFWPPARWLAGLILAAYLTVSLLFTLRLCSREGLRYAPLLPLIFVVIHVSFGLGFLVGLIRFAGRWGDRTGRVPALQPLPAAATAAHSAITE